MSKTIVKIELEVMQIPQFSITRWLENSIGQWNDKKPSGGRMYLEGLCIEKVEENKE